MCHSLTHILKLALQFYISRGGTQELIDLLIEEINRLEENKQVPKGYLMSGFVHSKLLVLTQDRVPKWCHWGLIPPWIKSKEEAMDIWNKTINARGESVFDKPSFRDAVKSKRCIIYADSFFEHFHLDGKTFPHRIFRRNGEPMVLAGLWQEWVDRSTGEVWNTCTILTTKANPLLSRIHNSPKLKEPRMPVILSEETEELWMRSDFSEEHMEKILHPYAHEEMDAYTVKRFLGKNAPGDVPEVLEKYEYEELVADQGTLF